MSYVDQYADVVLPKYPAKYAADVDPAWYVSGQPAVDKQWLHVVPCRAGAQSPYAQYDAKGADMLSPHLFLHGAGKFGFFGRGMALRKRLLAIDGVTSHQTGDEEFSVVFRENLLKRVAKVVRPKLTRKPTAKQLEALTAARGKVQKACANGPFSTQKGG